MIFETEYSYSQTKLKNTLLKPVPWKSLDKAMLKVNYEQSRNNS
ncbi:hypothetical protein GGQ60_000220 [Pedobacter zeae]|uniref:Uncharacterized protein n=1 Tax=Pedobacter zeae TaxID=1737356 RepID=A0A7W6K6T7_9SPHI|nr:hypothetical protein [Pedobacter zeae]